MSRIVLHDLVFNGLLAIGPVEHFEQHWSRLGDSSGKKGVYLTPLTEKGKGLVESVLMARRQGCEVQSLPDGVWVAYTNVPATADAVFASVRQHRQQEGHENDYNVDKWPLNADKTRCMDAVREQKAARVTDRPLVAANMPKARVEIELDDVTGKVLGVFLLSPEFTVGMRGTPAIVDSPIDPVREAKIEAAKAHLKALEDSKS